MGDRLLTVGVDNKVIIWNTWSGLPAHELRGAHSPGAGVVEALIFPDGERVATLGLDKQAVVWHSVTCEVLQRFNLTDVGQHRHIRIFPRGDRILTGASYGAQDPTVVWSMARGVAVMHIRQPEDMVRFIELSPCGGKIVTAGYEYPHVWNAFTGYELVRVPGGWITGLAVSPNGKKILLGHDHVSILIWDASTGQFERSIDSKDGVLGAPGDWGRFALVRGGRRVAFFTRS